MIDSGLARERTALSWSRTSLAVIVNGVLVLVRHENAFPLLVAAGLAGLSLVLAVLTLVHAARRHRIVHDSQHEIVVPRGPVAALGLGIALLGLATVLAILVSR